MTDTINQEKNDFFLQNQTCLTPVLKL